MSTIGTGIAASVAAQSVSERQAVAAKNARDRESDRVRRELHDRFSPSTAQVEEAGSVAAVEGDEESPADAKEQQRHSDRQRAKAEPAATPEASRGSLDIEA
ncbi:MAG: hypothetical protein ACTS22_05750 [Phycisphaerales bacterium]